LRKVGVRREKKSAIVTGIPECGKVRNKWNSGFEVHLISKDGHHEEPWPLPQPFLKWPGGKRWLWRTLQPLLPSNFKQYFEPFLGGGAIFFALHPKRAILSDINPELINAYAQIRDNVDSVIKGLSRLVINRRTYHRIRKASPVDNVERAVRFIYLSKTAFNGMYRVNQKGLFNVPFAGQQHRTLFESETLKLASAHLQGRELAVRDFADSLSAVKPGDLVYCDPPYTVLHDNNGFLRYNESLFSWSDQKRLAELAKAAAHHGACVVVSNARTDHVRALYAGFDALTVCRSSCISARSNSRRKVSEFLFISKL
jgi:DNA adenine methylase